MRSRTLLLSVSCLFLACLSNAPGLRPEEKEPIPIEEGERNPFARRGPATGTTVVEDTESEESRLRSLLEKMKVAGYTEGDDGASVLLGNYRMKPTQILPPLLANQTEKLQVVSVNPKRVELVFLESDGRPPSRSITLRYNLRPQVRFLLGTQVPESPPNASELAGKFPPDSVQTDDDPELP